MLLHSTIRLPPQPVESAEPVQLRRESSDPDRELARALGNARRAAVPEQAAVVHFGSRALGLARNQPPAADVSLAAERGTGERQVLADGGARAANVPGP